MLLQLLFFLFLYLPAESCNEYAGHLTEGCLTARFTSPSSFALSVGY